MSPNRIVAALTPLFTAVATLGSAYAAKHGLHLPAGDVLAGEITVGTSAAAAALKWLHGWQAAEKADADLRRLFATGDAHIENVVVKVDPAVSHAEAEKAVAKLTADAEAHAAAVVAQAQADAQKVVAHAAAELQKLAGPVQPITQSAEPAAVVAPHVTQEA